MNAQEENSLAFESLRVLLQQESTTYKRTDYLEDAVSSTSETDGFSSASTSSSGVNQEWRERICDWSYQVVDHFGFNRQTVSVSLDYLDRFLSTRRLSKETIQLAAMTTLYLAIKLYEPQTLKISFIISLSRGCFSARHVTAMEISILRELSWHMHPPTPQSFLVHFIEFFPHTTVENLQRKKDIVTLAHYLVELSVRDYFYATRKASCVAFAALQLALGVVYPSCSPFLSMVSDFLGGLRDVLAFVDKRPDKEISDCMGHLQEAYGEFELIRHIQDVGMEVGSPESVAGIFCESQINS